MAGYPGQFGNVLITKETLDKFIKTMVGVPVIINHKDITDKNADDERVGVVNSVWYDNKDGWYWCDGIIWNETAQNLITDKNWSVSCSYNVKTADNEGGSENNIKYDMEFLDGVFTHLALVNNPRYERANIVLNSKTEFINVNNEDKWITVHPNGEDNKGRPLLVREGETVKEAVERKVAEWDAKKEEEKHEPKQLGLKGFSKLKKDLERDQKALEKKDLKERNTTRKKINDLRDAWDTLSKEKTQDWARAKEIRDYMADLSSQMDKAEREARQKYNLDDDSLEDFLAEKSPYDKQSDKKEDKQEDKKEDKPEDKSNRLSPNETFYDDDMEEHYTKSYEENIQKDFEEFMKSREKERQEAKKQPEAPLEKTDLEAAKTRYNDVLSKYNTADKKRWESGLSNAEYHQAWTDAEKYKKELTGARREYAESIMANFQEVEENPYEERQQARRERYEELSGKAATESSQAHQQFRDKMSFIPAGQPIHGERDARYRERAWDTLGRAVKLNEKSNYYADKAKSVGKAGISSDDANAIAKLARKYKSGVDSAEKRRIIDRVIDIHKRSTSTAPESETTDYGFSVERNKDLNRLQLKFDSIPDANTRAILKSNGFRWSPREKAWQRQLNSNSEYSLKSVMEKMKADNSLLEGITDILEEHNVSKDDLPILEGIKNILG